MRKVLLWFKYFFLILGTLLLLITVPAGVIVGCIWAVGNYGAPAFAGLTLIGLAAWGATAKAGSDNWAG